MPCFLNRLKHTAKGFKVAGQARSIPAFDVNLRRSYGMAAD